MPYRKQQKQTLFYISDPKLFSFDKFDITEYSDFMKINTKIRYGLRMIVLLAENKKLINTAELGKQMDVSPKYLRKLAGPLEKAHIIKSIQGIHGGYILNITPENISIKMIFNAFNEEFQISQCLKIKKCGFFDECKVSRVWLYLEKMLEKEFFHISIADIISEKFVTGR